MSTITTQGVGTSGLPFDLTKGQPIVSLPISPTEAIATKATDIMVGKWLPETAKVMDKVCVVNSMTSRQGAHEQGTYIMHTSYDMRGTVKHPSLGAWVMKLGGHS